jgi:purine-binding chemotaxis protein CheW
MARQEIQSTHRSNFEAGLAGKYLTFKLQDEEFGLPIMKVQEIIGLPAITKFPKLPQYVRGVINLRGHIIPIVGLRAKFGMPSIQDTEKSCIIVAELAAQGGTLSLGLLVDQVSEVLDISPHEVSEAPNIGSIEAAAFILGVGNVKNGIKLLLDIDRVMGADEAAQLNRAVAQSNGQTH